MDRSKKKSGENPGRRQTDQVRLESWKAIANYMNRSVRTVRRWEVSEGLPVYRHRHNKGSSVHAYCSELDAWRLGHAVAVAPETALTAEEPRKRSFPPFVRNLAFLFFAAFAGGIVARFVPPNQSSPTLETSPVRDTAVIPERTVQVDSIVLPMPEVEKFTYWSESVARVIVLPLMSAWVDGRLQDALRESQRVGELLPNIAPEMQRYLVDYMIDFSLAMGRADDASEIAAFVQDRSHNHELMAKIMFAMGDMTGMRRHLESGIRFEDETTPLFMAMTGLVDEAVDLNSRLGHFETRAGRLNLILAISAIKDNDMVEAKSRLRAATDVLVTSDHGYYFVAMDMLSGLLQSEGHLQEAVRLLERTVPHRNVAAFSKSGIFWLMCQHQLANLYREAGREVDALQLENALRDRLIHADEDFPLAMSLAET